MFGFEVIEIRNDVRGIVQGLPSAMTKDYKVTHASKLLWLNGKTYNVPDHIAPLFSQEPVESITVMQSSNGAALVTGVDMTKNDLRFVWSMLGFVNQSFLTDGTQAPRIGYAAIPDDTLDRHAPSTWKSLLPPHMQAHSGAPKQETPQPLIGSIALIIALAVGSGPVGHHASTLAGGFLYDEATKRRYWDSKKSYQRPGRTGVVVNVFACKLQTSTLGSTREDLESLAAGRGFGPIFHC